MASKTKFESMLHTKITNKIIHALIYAILEWTLISLLLLNSLFSLFILKFAHFFGLKPPCFLCSRLDHKLQTSRKTQPSFSDIICEQHAAEISKLGYCSNHRKLVESQSLCTDCSSYPTPDYDVFKWMTQIEDVKKCCCCDMIILKPEMEDFVMINPKEDMGFDCDPKLGYEPLVNHDDVEENQEQEEEDVVFEVEKEPLLNKNKEIVSSDQNLCQDMLPQHLEFYIDHDDYRLIPVDLIKQGKEKIEKKISQDFELVLEGDELIPLGVVRKNLPSIEEEDEQEENNPVDDLVGDRVLVKEKGSNEEENKIDEKGMSILEEEVRNSRLGKEEGEIYERGLPILVGQLEKEEKREEEMQSSKIEHGEGEVEEKCLPISRDDEETEEQSSKIEQEEDEVEDKFLPISQDVEEREEQNLKIKQEEGEVVENCLPIEVQSLEFEQEEGTSEERWLTILQGQEERAVPNLEFKQGEGKIEEKCLPNLRDYEEREVQSSESEQEEDEFEEKCLPISRDQETKEKYVGEKIGREEEALLLGQEERRNHKEEELKTLHSTDISYAPIESPEEDTTSQLKSDEFDAEMNEESTRCILVQEKELPVSCDHETPSMDHNVVREVSISSTHLPSVDEHDGKQIEGENEGREVNLSMSYNEAEEERVLPDLHKKLFLLGRRESATEESLDGSMISELEGGGDESTTVEKLKLDLQSERKTLRSLYKELEEERNASAIAANHTMAMINKLQEEKATMQMEALQYQRMMEEQSEYDQEALQMMNELMVKRDKEKVELEKELEFYRKKVIDYEEREKMRILCNRRSRNSSTSCSYGEESDGQSIDLNHEVKEHEEDHATTTVFSPLGLNENGHQDTPSDAVLSLQDSLVGFEEERHAILEQLKVLEGKLFSLAEEEDDHIENMKPFEQFCEENGKDFEDGHGENGFSHERRVNGLMQKRLLPLFDATEMLESHDLNGNGAVFDSLEVHKSPVTNFELEKKRFAIEEEVDHVYERLQAFEADREFLKHCIGSLRKGDKGLDLLQEILQHLRDLKNVELQVMKNMDHCASV